MTIIALLNKTDGDISDSQAGLIGEACNLAMCDIAPFYEKLPDCVVFYANEDNVPDDAQRIVMFRTADQANALGYHTLDEFGRPYGRVFTSDTFASGGSAMTGPNSVSVTTSHEVHEMWKDPAVNAWFDGADGKSYADEPCDAVEGDSYDILIGGQLVAVSNFILPGWAGILPGNFDFLEKLTGPLTMTPGGYFVWRESGRINQSYGRDFPSWKRARKAFSGSRTAHRMASGILVPAAAMDSGGIIATFSDRETPTGEEVPVPQAPPARKKR